MKIISKYKDYYDHMLKVYGIDEKVVLDRSKFDHWSFYPFEGSCVSILFCDRLIEGISTGKEIIYGEEIPKRFPPKERKYSKKFERWLSRDGHKREEYVSDYYNVNGVKVFKKPRIYSREKSPNRIYNIPILMSNTGWGKIGLENYYKFPILEKLNFNRVYSPEEAYLMLYNWLQEEKPMEEISNNDKITGKGFDLKTSFRKM